MPACGQETGSLDVLLKFIPKIHKICATLRHIEGGPKIVASLSMLRGSAQMKQ